MMYFQNSLDWIAVLIIVVWLIGGAFDILLRVNRFKALRLTFWTVGMICIMFLYLEPYRLSESQPSKIALVSDAYKDHIDSLQSAGFQIAPPNTINKSLQTENLSELVLAGQPLQPWELQSVHAKNLTFKPSEAMGIVDFQLPEHIKKGEQINIKLTINTDQNHKIQLAQGDETLDSIGVKRGLINVTLSLTPKASGNQTYTLYGLLERDTLYTEILPMQVVNAEVPAVLLLNSNPNFEARFLKNHLGDFGYAVSSRTNISKEIANEEFINAPKSALTYLSESKLQAYQLLIVDGEAFEHLSATERRLIRDLNSQGNLGILVINTLSEEMGDLWTVEPKSILRQVSILGNDLQVYANTNSALSSITVDGQPVAYCQNNGIGKIGMLAVTNLYQLKLDGQAKIYEMLVKKITQPVTPFQKSNVSVHLPDVVRLGQKTSFQFISKSKEPVVLIDGTEHPVRESAYRPQYFESSFWPQKEGWNGLTILPDSINYDYFVFNHSQWTGKRQFELNQYNKLYAETYQQQPTENKLQSKKQISKWYFLIGFLVCMTILWVEQRFVNP